MIYTVFQDKKLSQLGFGTMLLPMTGSVIDEAQVADMVRLAMENGVNYFDTAWPYHGSESERVIGRVLAQYPRESWYLATKYPGHQISSSYDPAAIFEEQLCKRVSDLFTRFGGLRQQEFAMTQPVHDGFFVMRQILFQFPV